MIFAGEGFPALRDDIILPEPPLPGGERIEVRGSDVRGWLITVEPPLPSLSPPGRGYGS
jgi:hypothetical protein